MCTDAWIQFFDEIAWSQAARIVRGVQRGEGKAVWHGSAVAAVAAVAAEFKSRTRWWRTES